MSKPMNEEQLRKYISDEFLPDFLSKMPRFEIEPQWRPIETAPKDGTEVLATCNYGDGVHHAEVTAFCNGRWVVSNDDDGYAMQFRPSHWMPLPKPPCV